MTIFTTRMRGMAMLWLFLHSTLAFDLRNCDQGLGMESGDIPDSAITATSSYVPNVGPQNGRLRVEKAGGGWCPKQQVERGIREYLQIDLGQTYIITGIQTQGRYDHGRGQEYMEEYNLEYWRPGFDKWKEYSRWDGKQIISGNTDTETVVSHRLLPIIHASKIRILPYSVHRRTVCLRVEVKGCLADDGIVSYDVPEDPQAGLDLSDVSYDGQRVGGFLVGGLGRLVDGEVGVDNFRLDIGYGKGNGWVGWNKDSFPKRFVEITFQFQDIRNFSAVHLFTNNFYSKDVQVFAKAKLFFSIGGKFFNGRPILYSYMPDIMLDLARNVSIHLHGRIARFVKIHLYFANRWIMLSEITFESDPMGEGGNFTEELELDMENEEIFMNYPDLSLNSLETIAARKDGQSYVEAVIGVLTAMVLLLLIVFVIILVLSKRHKLQGSPTILRNPFGVTINMKDLLMNLAPSNNNGMVAVSSQPTPVGQETQAGQSPDSFEQYRSPLVNAFTGPNYATLRSNTDDVDGCKVQEDTKMTPPPSPAATNGSYSPQKTGYSSGSFSSQAMLNGNFSPSKMNGFVTQKNIYATPNLIKDTSPVYTSMSFNNVNQSPQKQSPTHHYRTLQNSSIVAPRNQISNGGFVPRVSSSDPPQRKRYNTAPREKNRIPPPVVSWNIAPSMGQTYKCRESELVPIPRYCLRVVEKLGTCHAGEIILCETEGLEDILPNCGKTVAVRTGSNNTVSGTTATNSLREVRFLASLTDPNIARILGVCTAEQPPWVILEHTDIGDLAQYLQYRTTGNSFSTKIVNNVQALSYGCLIYMAMQIAAATKYLESKNVVHKDLAARNCLVGSNYTIKVSDTAMCSPLYRKDYSEIGGRPLTPIRWLPWESILLDRYTCSSTVWSLAVTIWEIINLAQERPFQQLSNEEVIQAAEQMYYGGELEVLLPKPSLCHTELYQLLCLCWQREESERPSNKKVYNYLKTHNAGYNPSQN